MRVRRTRPALLARHSTWLPTCGAARAARVLALRAAGAGGPKRGPAAAAEPPTGGPGFARSYRGVDRIASQSKRSAPSTAVGCSHGSATSSAPSRALSVNSSKSGRVSSGRKAHNLEARTIALVGAWTRTAERSVVIASSGSSMGNPTDCIRGAFKIGTRGRMALRRHRSAEGSSRPFEHRRRQSSCAARQGSGTRAEGAFG